jgi:hypothetical protein
MPNGYHGLVTATETRHGHQLEYSIMMISNIAAAYDSAVDRNEFLCARAMLDAFYVHIRLLAEFLVKDTPGRDFGPADFDVAWAVPATVEAERLVQYWATASAYVVHFGRRRVPDDLDDLQRFEVTGSAFKEMADNALIVFAEFLRRLEQVTPPWSDGSRIPDREAEPEAWSARVLFDRTNQLRASFVEACGKVGLDGRELLRLDQRASPQ